MDDQYIYKLAEQEWQDFLALLERPSRDMPKLRLLMSRPSPFEGDE